MTAVREARAAAESASGEAARLRDVLAAESERAAALRSTVGALEADGAAARAEVERLRSLLAVSEGDRTSLHEALGEARLQIQEMELQAAQVSASPRFARKGGK